MTIINKLNLTKLIEWKGQNIKHYLVHECLFIKELAFWKINICRPVYREIVENVLNLKTYESGIDELSLQNARFISINSDSIGIEYQILDRKKIIYHKLENDDGY